MCKNIHNSLLSPDSLSQLNRRFVLRKYPNSQTPQNIVAYCPNPQYGFLDEGILGTGEKIGSEWLD